MISVKEALELVNFTREEDLAVAKMEASIDAALHSKFDGAPMILTFDRPLLKAVYAIQRSYEERGGWKVNVRQEGEKCSLYFVPLFFTPPQTPTRPPTKVNKKTLPPMVETAVFPAFAPGNVAPVASFNGKRLLVRMPTRGRPVQALETLKAYREKAGAPITLEVVIDHDDETMLGAEVLQRLNALGCVITVGEHRSKVEAVNAGRVTEWDVLLLASDDMVPVADNYAYRVLEAMEEHWPHSDGALYFDDGYQGAGLCTLPIIGRRFYDRFGYVYHPDYISLFSDLEQTELWLSMGRLKYVDEKLIEHRHHIWGKAAVDATYERNDAFEKKDKATYERRKGKLYDFDRPPLSLSILICSIPERRAQLDRLVDELYRQMYSSRDYDGLTTVDILIDVGAGSIGAKRQRLLERAKSQYVAFVDDDDWIAHDYVDCVLSAIYSQQPAPDCVSLTGVMTTAGAVPERFEHSLQHSEWATVGGVYVRPPNHLNAIRRDLALKVGFKDKSHAEDFDFSNAIRPLLKTEVSAGSRPLYYYWYQPAKKTGWSLTPADTTVLAGDPIETRIEP